MIPLDCHTKSKLPNKKTKCNMFTTFICIPIAKKILKYNKIIIKHALIFENLNFTPPKIKLKYSEFQWDTTQKY